MFTPHLLCDLAILICRVDFQVSCVIRAACLAVIEMPLRRPALNPRRGISLILNTLISSDELNVHFVKPVPREERSTHSQYGGVIPLHNTHTFRMCTPHKVSLGVLICFYIDLHSLEWVRKCMMCAWWCEKSFNICAWWVCVICVIMCE